MIRTRNGLMPYRTMLIIASGVVMLLTGERAVVKAASGYAGLTIGAT